MALWEAVQGQGVSWKGGHRLLFHCRREGLFQPVGNVLDKSKLMIYQYSSQSFGGDCTPPSSLGWDGMGW